MKAYIYSTKNGTVQIGNTLFQPCTNSMFKVGRPKPTQAIATVEVVDATMEQAKKALQAIAKPAYGN